MVGIDRNTGRTITAWDQLVSRVTQVMTTRIGTREKRRTFGSRVPDTLGRSMSDKLLVLAQSYALAAFYEPINGINDFTPTRCVATRGGAGIILQIHGLWNGEERVMEVGV